MTFVRRAAYRVNNAVADIKRVHYRSQDTKVGLRSRDDRRVRLTLAQMLGQLGLGRGRVAAALSMTVAGGQSAASGGINSNNRRSRHSRVAKAPTGDIGKWRSFMVRAR